MNNADEFRRMAATACTRTVFLTIFLTILMVMGETGSAGAASPVPNTVPGIAAATPIASSEPVPTATAMHEGILSFLGTVTDWYQHLSVEAQLVTAPGDNLFFTDDRQIADEVVKLAFDYARASAMRIAAAGRQKPVLKANSSSAGAAPEIEPSLAQMTAKLSEARDAAATAQARADSLKARIATASRATRTSLSSQLVAVEGELDLAHSRIDALNAMIDFENRTAGANRVGDYDLISQIDQLQRSLPTDLSPQIKATEAAEPKHSSSSGIFDLAEQLFDLQRKSQTLQSSVTLTRNLAATVEALRAPLIDALHKVEQNGAALAANGAAGDLSAVHQRKQAFDSLVNQHKAIVAELLPLSQIHFLLDLYVASLNRWDQAIDRPIAEVLHGLVVRLIVLGSLVGLIMIGAVMWRRLTFRYVSDARHRHRLLQVRTLAVIVLLLIVVLFNFSNEIGALATVMGLATAGIAFALQNVILSVAGYFFLSGRYGVKVGDRVQIAGVYGTVIDIGLVKLTLMELTGEGNYRQPTGRVVVFANSIVFQSNGNFFKQAPGFSFSWNELMLTLAPDCDFALAEKIITDAVNDVCARYRENLRREYRETARSLNVWFEPPEPQSRLLLGSSGITITIRYPVEARRAIDINDEISRRVLNVIKHEPRLRLVSTGTPTIQAVAPPVEDGVGTAAAVPTMDDPGEAHPPNPVGKS
jgi:small-conductance mechanosensitive channel